MTYVYIWYVCLMVFLMLFFSFLSFIILMAVRNFIIFPTLILVFHGMNEERRKKRTSMNRLVYSTANRHHIVKKYQKIERHRENISIYMKGASNIPWTHDWSTHVLFVGSNNFWNFHLFRRFFFLSLFILNVYFIYTHKHMH